MPDTKSVFDIIATTVQVAFVVAGFGFSVHSFNSTRKKEAEARKLEAARPFLQLRQNLYTEAVKAAATLANPPIHTEEEINAARRRFRDLYVAELSMVEAPGVEHEMMKLAEQIDPELLTFTPAQTAAYDLAHALRNSFVSEWQLRDEMPADPDGAER
jgi:hypothetical protein